MTIKQSLSVALISTTIILPFLYIALMLGQYDDVMIRDQSSDYTLYIRAALFCYLATVAWFCREILLTSVSIGGLWTVTALWLLVNCGDYYNHIHERYIFSFPNTINSRVVMFDGVRREASRSGKIYYARVFLNRTDQHRFEVKIGKDLFDIWQETVVSSPNYPECLLRVDIARVGTAERIIVRNGYLTSASLVKCGSGREMAFRM